MAIGPTATALSTLLSVGAGPISEALRGAIRAIDLVHGDGNVGPVDVSQRKLRGPAVGLFTPGVRGQITVSNEGPEPGLTLLHEVGHLLDHSGIELRGGWRTNAPRDARLDDWWRAVEASVLYQRLQKLSGQRTMLIPRGWGTSRDRVEIDQSWVTDRLCPRERFACSYAQYVITESKDPALLVELEKCRRRYQAKLYPEQWTDDDFVPIGAAVDALFRKLRWRT